MEREAADSNFETWRAYARTSMRMIMKRNWSMASAQACKHGGTLAAGQSKRFIGIPSRRPGRSSGTVRAFANHGGIAAQAGNTCIRGKRMMSTTEPDDIQEEMSRLRYQKAFCIRIFKRPYHMLAPIVADAPGDREICLGRAAETS